MTTVLGVLLVRRMALLIVVAISGSALAESIPCWMDHDRVAETTQMAVLKSYLLPIRLATPEEDMKARVDHQDYRFIAIGAFGMTYPGLHNKELLCKYGYQFIAGTSDAFESKEHRELIRSFTDYAEKYNKALEAFLLTR